MARVSQVKSYNIDCFKKEIADAAGTVDNFDVAASSARKKADDKASQWTDGRFLIPTLEEFKISIEKARGNDSTNFSDFAKGTGEVK